VRRTLAAVAVASLALGACQAEPSPAPAPWASVHVALYRPQFVEMGIVPGVLTSHEDCLFIESDTGETYGVGWPVEFTTWDPWSGTIRVRQVGARIGDRVTIGGGIEEISPSEIGLWRWARPPRPDCLGDGFFFASGIEIESD